MALKAWKRDLDAIQNEGDWNRAESCEILVHLMKQLFQGLKEGKKDPYW